MAKNLKNVHPGEILLEEFLKPLALSQSKIAHDMGVTPRRINEIVLGRRRITADTAIRLAYFFGTSEEFWMGLQDDYELEEARHTLKDRLKTIVHPLISHH
jgi:addiction module HigA family antidote